MDRREIYQRILRVIKHFLDRAASNLSIEALSNLDDPTLEQIAEDVVLLTAVMERLAIDEVYSDENLSINARQACIHLKRLVDIVRDQEQDELDGTIRDLEMLVDGPY